MAEWIPELLTFLRRNGAQPPAVVLNRFGISQPTLNRWVKQVPDELVALGGPRNRRIAALRSIRGMGARHPLFEINEAREIRELGTLLATYPNSFIFVPKSAPTRPIEYAGLPFFLDDLRPQGFLGRSFGKRYPELRLPQRIQDWSPDDVFEAIARRGEDLVGNLLIGRESFERYQRILHEKPTLIEASSPEESYARLAQLSMEGEVAGSSAGGEHPKFTALLSGLEPGRHSVTPVLVKFSPLSDSFAAKRWSDLLVAEGLALETLRTGGIPSAQGRIIQAGGRTFLETIRFDRVGARGRKPLVSLAAMQAEWLSATQNWATSADQLEIQGRIASEDAERIRVVECFGRLIANSDRHAGNLSFHWRPGEKQARLAPIYDMLPMLYAPVGGTEDPGQRFQYPTYEPELHSAWKSALPLARIYWERVIADPRISDEFRALARENLKTLVNA